MSILDFARHIGRQVFDRDEVAAERIKQDLELTLAGFNELEVTFDDGVVTLVGECLSQAYCEKAILIAGNVKGVERVIADDLRVPSDSPAVASESSETAGSAETVEEKVEFYEIKSGDTLSGIAKAFYGNAMQYSRIFEANREVIGDPDKIYQGQKIRIPVA